MDIVRQKVATWRFAHWVYAGLFAIWCVYAYVSMASGLRMGTSQNSGLSMELLRLTILIPVLAIWFVAMRGSVRLKQYVQLINEDPDGKALNSISTGLLMLVLYIVLLSVFNSIVILVADTQYLDVVIFLRNHVPVTLALVSLAFIYVGSEGLNALVRSSTWTRKRFLGAFVPFCILAALFSWAFYSNFVGIDSNGLPRYTLPKDVLMFSYVLPHLAGWFLGIMAVMNILNYSRKTNGTLYRQAFKNLSIGILGVLVSLILVQMFGILTTAITRLPLAYLLILVYLLLIVAAIGFVYIYRGVQKLELLESVNS